MRRRPGDSRGRRLTIWHRLRRWSFLSAQHRTIAGLRVANLVTDDSEIKVAYDKLTTALTLLDHNAPKYTERLRRHADGIVIQRTVASTAEWDPKLRLVYLNEFYTTARDTTPEEIALLLVHEGTHAWLTSLGIPYPESLRARVERICATAELLVARRFPDNAALIEGIHSTLSREPSFWSNGAERERTDDDLHALGIPRWVLAAFAKLRRRLPQN
jgi:hypothetical protein